MFYLQIQIILLLVGCANENVTSTTTPLPIPTATATTALMNPELTPGQIVTVNQSFGTYHQYIPTTLDNSPDIVVIVHGTPGKKEDVKAVAKFYLKNWVALAEKRSVILIAPVFDQENFGSQNGDAVLGGYRALFGRQIGADVLVMQIVDQYLRLFQATDPRFYLYGHSAGGQFVAHFIVRHPERVKRAVISAALIYPYPDSTVAWPYGMGKLQTTIRWHETDPAVALDINPDVQGWIAAATLPITVVVGLNDTEPQLDWPGQQGHNRLAIAQNWVHAMRQLAAQHGREATIELSVIPGIGHSSFKLLPYCQKALLP